MNAIALDATPVQPVLRLLDGQRPTLDYVFDTPLAEMTAELHVEVTDAQITDDGFFGYVAVSGSRVIVRLNPNLSEFERDFFIRYLTAQAYKLPMTPLPTPFEVELSPMLEGVPA
ncbi:hypothetical protein [Streptomyces sp. cmx-4-9]|uniref:hypothetical protein n=1 Tax=Streptomyces sp. cmx-4-9 TaxID=2790941 RepID=UPI00397F6E49